MGQTICIAAISAAVLLLSVAVSILRKKFDDLLDMVISLSGAITQIDKDLAEMHGTLSAAKELISAAKEATDIQLEIEKKFRDGLQSIIDY